MLRGKELHDRARELDIPGRSKMTADELRAAVIAFEEDTRQLARWVADPAPSIPHEQIIHKTNTLEEQPVQLGVYDISVHPRMETEFNRTQEAERRKNRGWM